MLAKRMDTILQQMIPFWKSLRDDVHGGYYGLVTDNLKTQKEADKGCIYHSRILWFFSTAARVTNDATLLPYAKHAYEFLRDRLRDSADGRELGYYWSVRHDGTPADTDKYTYCQAFAMYGLSSYARATGEREPLELAQMAAAVIERGCRDDHGYLDAFDRDLAPYDFAYKLSENGILARRTMNTILHVAEGYAELCRACDETWAAERLRRDLTVFRDKLFEPDKKRLRVFYKDDYQSQLDIQSYGHDIEAAWLLDDAASALHDKDFAKTLLPMTDALAESVFARAFHEGSVWNECAEGNEDRRRVWWVQAEAVNGFLGYHQKHPEATAYRDAALAVLAYIETQLIDPREGSEWLAGRDADGAVTAGKPIAESWKGPYHNGRMTLLGW